MDYTVVVKDRQGLYPNRMPRPADMEALYRSLYQGLADMRPVITHDHPDMALFADMVLLNENDREVEHWETFPPASLRVVLQPRQWTSSAAGHIEGRLGHHTEIGAHDQPIRDDAPSPAPSAALDKGPSPATMYVIESPLTPTWEAGALHEGSSIASPKAPETSSLVIFGPQEGGKTTFATTLIGSFLSLPPGSSISLQPTEAAPGLSVFHLRRSDGSVLRVVEFGTPEAFDTFDAAVAAARYISNIEDLRAAIMVVNGTECYRASRPLEKHVLGMYLRAFSELPAGALFKATIFTRCEHNLQVSFDWQPEWPQPYGELVFMQNDHLVDFSKFNDHPKRDALLPRLRKRFLINQAIASKVLDAAFSVDPSPYLPDLSAVLAADQTVTTFYDTARFDLLGRKQNLAEAVISLMNDEPPAFVTDMDLRHPDGLANGPAYFLVDAKINVGNSAGLLAGIAGGLLSDFSSHVIGDADKILRTFLDGVTVVGSIYISAILQCRTDGDAAEYLNDLQAYVRSLTEDADNEPQHPWLGLGRDILAAAVKEAIRLRNAAARRRVAAREDVPNLAMLKLDAPKLENRTEKGDSAKVDRRRHAGPPPTGSGGSVDWPPLPQGGAGKPTQKKNGVQKFLHKRR